MAAILLLPRYTYAAQSAANTKKLEAYWEFSKERLSENWPPLLLSIGITIVATLFCAWGIARLLAGKTGTFLNVLKYYLISLSATVALVAICGAGLFYFLFKGQQGGAMAIGVLLTVGLLIISFALPMKILEIGFLRTLGFNMLLGISSGIIESGVGLVVPSPFEDFANKSGVEQEAIVQEWDTKRRAKAMEERMAALTPPAQPTAPAQAIGIEQVKAMQLALQKEREALDVKDQPAVQRFNERVAEYNAAKARLKPVPSTPAPATPKPGRKSR
jgi:hypothetical protein